MRNIKINSTLDENVYDEYDFEFKNFKDISGYYQRW